MFTTPITPRFNDTDGLGHVNHAAVVMWFETARRPVFQLFNPSLDLKRWNLIVVRIEVDYKRQLQYQQDVEIATFPHHLGNSSFHLTQQARQEGELCAVGKSILVHFDYQAQRPAEIPPTVREQLQKHLQSH